MLPLVQRSLRKQNPDHTNIRHVHKYNQKEKYSGNVYRASRLSFVLLQTFVKSNNTPLLHNVVGILISLHLQGITPHHSNTTNKQVNHQKPVYEETNQSTQKHVDDRTLASSRDNNRANEEECILWNNGGSGNEREIVQRSSQKIGEGAMLSRTIG